MKTTGVCSQLIAWWGRNCHWFWLSDVIFSVESMKILSVFTHPHVVPKLYVFICSAFNQQISFPIDYHSRKKYILW